MLLRVRTSSGNCHVLGGLIVAAGDDMEWGIWERDGDTPGLVFVGSASLLWIDSQSVRRSFGRFEGVVSRDVLPIVLKIVMLMVMMFVKNLRRWGI